MKTASLLVAVACVVLGACSSLSTSFDYDTDHDFSGLATYGWIDRQPDSIGMKRVRQAVDTVLVERGFRLVEERPDFQVAAHISSAERIQVVDWGYTYRPYGTWYGGGRDIDVWQYEEGTLIVDIIDPGQSALVWRGTAKKPVDRSWTPEERDAEVLAAVRALLAKFPPK
ncbi:MAG: DUF4136 domain-containing protein [Planctomycetes bacterium]|nr:DUF4136 domain-containing protein [Planctomycetota bacterium]